jgi:hypothetical protein
VVEAVSVITEGLRLAAKIAVALEYANTEGGRSCVKFVVVMEYAIMGKKGDIALSVEAMAFVLMENVRIAAKFVNVSKC